jgi:hypothetical protein
MRDFINHFDRQSDGSWQCTSSAEFTHILGRIQVAAGSRFAPGTIFMGVDIVRLLEQERERQLRT